MHITGSVTVTEETQRMRWLKAHADKNALLFEVRLDVVADDWDGAMSALFAIASELWWRGSTVPASWQYSPGCAADPREHEDSLFGVCEETLDDDLHYAGNVLHRYIRRLEAINPNRG
jgi:hypothetical protein